MALGSWRAPQQVGGFDVVVVGAGSAGSTAAIAAARREANVLLIDKLPFLGGTSTAVLDTFYGFYTPGSKARKVVGGIADEVVTALRELGPVLERPNTYGAGKGFTYLAEHLKVVWEGLARDAGVAVLLHAFVQDVAVSHGRVHELLVATKAGLLAVPATAVVDATGDADLCHFGGFGYETAGELQPAQTLTTTFRMANVNVRQRKELTKAQLHALMAEAAANGFRLPRLDGSDHVTPVDGVTATVMTRLEATKRGSDGKLVSATEPWFLSEAEQEGRRQALEYARFLVERVPGYASASLVALSTGIGVRETRRVYGDYRLTREDVLSGRQFDDQIGLCGCPIEDHRPGQETEWAYLPEGAAVGIPLRTLIVRDATNVIVAGRCFSATHDAHASVRSMAQCMAMGEAAGCLAAISALRAGGEVRRVSHSSIREDLRQSGAVVDLEGVTTCAP